MCGQYKENLHTDKLDGAERVKSTLLKVDFAALVNNTCTYCIRPKIFSVYLKDII